MKIGVMSDTHDNLKIVKEIVDYFNEEEVGYILHAGDIVAPFILKGLKSLYSPMAVVFGNNDGDKILLCNTAKELGFDISHPPKKMIIDKKNILLLHSPDELGALIDSKHYDIIIYGHTHEVDLRKQGQILIFNPGEAGGWVSEKHTIGIIDTQSLEAKVIEL